MKWVRELLDDLKKTFRGNLLSAVIFGSVARGEDFPDSDIDILIICSYSYEEAEKQVRKIELKYTISTGRKVNIVVYTSDDFEYMIEQKFPFIFGVASGYKILYDHNRFFKKQMEKIKELAKKEKIKKYSKSHVWVIKS